MEDLAVLDAMIADAVAEQTSLGLRPSAPREEPAPSRPRGALPDRRRTSVDDGRAGGTINAGSRAPAPAPAPAPVLPRAWPDERSVRSDTSRSRAPGSVGRSAVGIDSGDGESLGAAASGLGSDALRAENEVRMYVCMCT